MLKIRSVDEDKGLLSEVGGHRVAIFEAMQVPVGVKHSQFVRTTVGIEDEGLFSYAPQHRQQPNLTPHGVPIGVRVTKDEVVIVGPKVRHQLVEGQTGTRDSTLLTSGTEARCWFEEPERCPEGSLPWIADHN